MMFFLRYNSLKELFSMLSIPSQKSKVRSNSKWNGDFLSDADDDFDDDDNGDGKDPHNKYGNNKDNQPKTTRSSESDGRSKFTDSLES